MLVVLNQQVVQRLLPVGLYEDSYTLAQRFSQHQRLVNVWKHCGKAKGQVDIVQRRKTLMMKCAVVVTAVTVMKSTCCQ